MNIDIIGERRKGIFNPDLADKLNFGDPVPKKRKSKKNSTPEIDPFNLELVLNGSVEPISFWQGYFATQADVKPASLADLYACFKGLREQKAFSSSEGVANLRKLLKSENLYLDTGLFVSNNSGGWIRNIEYTVRHNGITSSHKFHLEYRATAPHADTYMNHNLPRILSIFKPNPLVALLNEEDIPLALIHNLEDGLGASAVNTYFSESRAQNNENLVQSFLSVRIRSVLECASYVSRTDFHFSNDHNQRCFAYQKKVKQ
jgi:hypothetical protein